MYVDEWLDGWMNKTEGMLFPADVYKESIMSKHLLEDVHVV